MAFRSRPLTNTGGRRSHHQQDPCAAVPSARNRCTVSREVLIADQVRRAASPQATPIIPGSRSQLDSRRQNVSDKCPAHGRPTIFRASFTFSEGCVRFSRDPSRTGTRVDSHPIAACSVRDAAIWPSGTRGEARNFVAGPRERDLCDTTNETGIHSDEQSFLNR